MPERTLDGFQRLNFLSTSMIRWGCWFHQSGTRDAAYNMVHCSWQNTDGTEILRVKILICFGHPCKKLMFIATCCKNLDCHSATSYKSFHMKVHSSILDILWIFSTSCFDGWGFFTLDRLRYEYQKPQNIESLRCLAKVIILISWWLSCSIRMK